MKKTSIILSLISILFVSSNIIAQNWEKKADKDGVVVYTRSVAGSSFKEFKGETTVKSSLNALVALVDDHDAMINWMHNCSESKLLKRLNRTEGYNYTVTKAPWPVTDRDVITKFSLHQDPKTKVVVITLKGEKDFIPEKSGKVRVSDLKGKWQFEPLGNGNVKVTYQLHTEPSGSIPSSVANAFVVDLPFESLKNLRKEVTKPKYVNAKQEGLEEL